MAQPNILFYKGDKAPDKSTHGIGTLWFDKTNRVLKVRIAVAGTDSDWEQYAGKIDDITLTNGIMTIKKANGTNYTIDLTDIASAGAVKDALDNLDAKIAANDTAIKANAAAITKETQDRKDADTTLQNNIDAVDGRVTAEASRADTAEKALDAKIVAMDTAYKAADSSMQDEIDTLKSQITGLNGTLHFRGVTDTEPNNPAVGDFYIKTDGTEYICTQVEGGVKWEMLGDTDAEKALISALDGRVKTAEDDIDALEDRMTTAEEEIDALQQGFNNLENRFYTETEVDGKVSNLQGQITDNAGDITDLQDRAKDIEDAATELSGKVTANENAIKTKADKTALEAAVGRIAANETSITSLNQSTSANSQAITKEAQDRATADTTLQNNINTVDGKVTTEKERAEAAEGALDTKIDGVAGRVATIETTELPGVKDRIKAIEDLKITSTYATKAALKTEEDDRKAADSALDARITTCETALTWSGF